MFPEMPCFYILDEDGETPVRATPEECAVWLATNHHRCIVEKTTIGDVEISTVFLKMDHNMSVAPGKPVLWETMTFGGNNHDSVQWRYTSLKEARIGHKKMIWKLRGEAHVKAS